jgi:hypothetical protein
MLALCGQNTELVKVEGGGTNGNHYAHYGRSKFRRRRLGEEVIIETESGKHMEG